MNIVIFLLVIVIIEVTYLVYKSGAIKIGNKTKHAVFVDTSALMDGRVVTAAQTGYIPGNLVIPKSVVNELQLLADQADHEKRSRARRGLDAIHELQAMQNLSVTILDDAPVGSGGVDDRLVELARKHQGSICTIDFNLNKVAQTHGIFVLNINELAGSIRMAFLPGETISLPLTQKGQNSDQAVGYLADGTMVVVDKAGSQIGKTVQVEFIRSLQTAAGRMMFAKLLVQPKPKDSNPPASSKKQSDRRPAGKQPVRRPVQAKRSVEDSLIDLVNNQ